jgi:3D (Asp-Asp-Asp) domain-containing protein
MNMAAPATTMAGATGVDATVADEAMAVVAVDATVMPRGTTDARRFRCDLVMQVS